MSRLVVVDQVHTCGEFILLQNHRVGDAEFAELVQGVASKTAST